MNPDIDTDLRMDRDRECREKQAEGNQHTNH